MSQERRIVREMQNGGLWCRAVLIHGVVGQNPWICISGGADNEISGDGPVWLHIELAEELANTIANLITIARLPREL